jgi:hypothetical protein
MVLGFLLSEVKPSEQVDSSEAESIAQFQEMLD